MKKTLLLNLLTLVSCLLLSQGLRAQKFPFRNKFPTPPTLSGPTFNLSVEQNSTHIFDPDSTMGDTFVTPITTYGYKSSSLQPSQQMDYLGPTLLWTKGSSLNFNIQNNLVGHETTVHWHGLNLPAMMDGGPHEIIAAPGQGGMNPWMPAFNVIDNIQTVWYHSHLMDSTTEQVSMGLSGMILVQDSVNDNIWDSLPHQYGVNDIPVILQEKGFNFTGAKATSLLANNHPGKAPYTLINGVFNPYKKVPAQVVRLRLLNGSARKSYQLGISDVLKNPSSASFETLYLAATDGGYTQMTYPMDSLLISPGERMEMLVNFSGMHGDTFYLSNLLRSIPIDIVTGQGGPTPKIYGDAFMAFIVDSNIKPSTPFTRVPTTLVPSYSVDTITTPIFKRRTKYLVNISGSPGGGGTWSIDSTGMDMERLDDTVLVNTMEMWTINNATNISHPFHIHKVQFQVVSYTGAIGAGNVNNDTTYVFQLPPNPGPKVKLLPTYMRGYKDDVLVRANASMTFVARFDSFPSTRDPITKQLDVMDGFMYHCHILTHEDDSMMHQFIVVDAPTYYNWPVGVPSPKANEAFVLYPNPAGDVLNLKGTTNYAGHLRLVDLMGRTLKEQEIAAFNGQLQIQVADLPRGLIFVEWTSGNTRSVQKVYLR